MLVRPVQPQKPVRFFTELGMVILVRPVQPLNASPLIVVTELGIVMLVRPVQLEKPLRVFMELGMSILVRPVQYQYL